MTKRHGKAIALATTKMCDGVFVATNFSDLTNTAEFSELIKIVTFQANDPGGFQAN